MIGEGSPKYTMGDNDVAGERLALLSELFGPTSAALIEHISRPGRRLAVDLGCGPGHTTALLALRGRTERTVGLDASPNFVERARRRYRSLEFGVHDITQTPFPTPAADLLFARFLLAHLPEPATVIDTWCSQLAAGGRLATEETERIDTDVDTFMLYEQTTASMIAYYGANLYVGATTRDLPPPSGTRVVVSQATEVRPATAVVARVYAMNLATWRHDPFIIDTVAPSIIETISEGLTDLQSSDAIDQLVFRNRQVVYEHDRRGGGR